jgi:hypothetical protein
LRNQGRRFAFGGVFNYALFPANGGKTGGRHAPELLLP